MSLFGHVDYKACDLNLFTFLHIVNGVNILITVRDLCATVGTIVGIMKLVC
jgi:hypothetical protein